MDDIAQYDICNKHYADVPVRHLKGTPCPICLEPDPFIDEI